MSPQGSGETSGPDHALLLGSTGQVGTALVGLFDRVTAPARAELDLGKMTTEQARGVVASARPDAIVNCAGYTAVDRAEEERTIVDRVNGAAVGELAAVAAESGIPFVTYSTDYVFDGRNQHPYLESSPTDPINAYGRSKLIGEQLALAANPRTLVIRTSWVISGTHPNFVATMLRLASEGRELRVVDDQWGCPTIADDLAAATLDALNRQVSGVLHLTNQGPTTWFQLARSSAELAGYDPALISPCSTEEYPTPAKRPAYSVLGSERREELGLAALPPWRESLPDLVRRLRTT